MSLKRILLVQPFLGHREKIIFPIGLHALSCYLHWKKPDVAVRILDQNLAEDPDMALRRSIGEFAPDLIGIALRNIDTTNRSDLFYYYPGFVHLLSRIREIAPHTPLAAGGGGFSMYAGPIMNRHREIDFGLFLEAEETLVELTDRIDSPQSVKGLYHRAADGVVHFTGHRPSLDLAAVPPRTRTTVNPAHYREYGAFGIEYQRGCSLSCEYCSYPFLGGLRVRRRPPETVVQEMAFFSEEHGVELFHLTDPVFNLPQENAVDFCHALTEAALPVKWIAWFNERYLDRNLVRLALAAGCAEFVFSPDGYGNRSLETLRKNIRQEDIRRSFRLAKEIREMRVSYNFIANPPGETLRTFMLLLLFNIRAKLALRSRLVAFFINHIRIEPDTGLYRRALEEGILKSDQDLLPGTVKELSRLFYRNPPASRYFWILLLFRLGKTLSGRTAALLRRGRGKPDPGPARRSTTG